MRLVAVLAPRWTATSSLAAELSARATAGALPAGVVYPLDAAWFGRMADRITVHPELVELSGASRPTDGHGALRARPPQARQVVRDRLRRVADDARDAGAHTLVLVAPGAAWLADPSGLRRELRTVADSVDVVLPVRRPDDALAAALAQSVRLAEQTGETTLTARAALASDQRAHEHRYADLLRRWTDPDGKVRVLVTPVSGGSAVDALVATLGLDPSADAVAETAGSAAVVPPPSREALAAIAGLARRRARVGWVPGVRRRTDAQLAEVRRAADDAALAGAAPFAFTDSERRMLARRFRGDREAVRAHVAWQWPEGAPAGPLRDAWLAWFAED